MTQQEVRSYGFWYRVIGAAFALIHPLRIIGRENIPEEGPLVVAANHTSLTDPLCAVFAFRRRDYLLPMSKIEARKIPVIGRILHRVGVIFVDRGAADMKAAKAALHLLRNKGKLLIFPEGTRIRNGVDKNGNPPEAKGGAALFATRSGAALMPMYIPEKKKWFFGRSTIVIGKPYYPQIAGRKATTEELDAITKELMERLHALEELAV